MEKMCLLNGAPGAYVKSKKTCYLNRSVICASVKTNNKKNKKQL